MVIEQIESWTSDERYDVVIVDEGQDFSGAQLLACLSLLKPVGSTYTLFADWRQDVYRKGSTVAVGADVIFTLHHNCRNTVMINDRANYLCNGSVAPMPGLPQGVSPIVEAHTSSDTMASRAMELASAWSLAGAGVAILSPYTLQNCSLGMTTNAFGLVITEDIARLGQPGHVVFSTIKGFKGVEATSVVVVDLDQPGGSVALSESDFYVSCTRPTARLAPILFS